jgi:DNA-binding IclR family transcriptional regulator
MDMSGGDAVEPPSWFEASAKTLDPLLNAASLLALVESAEASGLLRALRVTATPSEVARETGLPESQVRDICDALAAGGVAERVGTGIRLTADWDALTSAAAFAPLADGLRMNDVMTRTLRDLPGQGGFADLSTADRLTYAGAV